MKSFAFTIDLESEYAGFVDQSEILKERDKTEKLLSALDSLNVKVTVFVVAKLFELFPDLIKIFEKHGCEFEVHSFSHNLNNPDSEFEIEQAKSAYFNYFKKDPKGYRAPQGKISKSGIKAMEKHGFLYDSSIFPSYFPNPLRYLFCCKDIHYHKNSKIMEIPFTSISFLRLTLSISYIKLFGMDFYKKLFRLYGLPDVICFDSHLHDFFFIESAYNKLSHFWKFIYGRNKFRGIDYCIEFLEHIKREGYQFCFMSEIYKLHKR